MSDDQNTFNPYQPSIDPLSNQGVAADQRFVSQYVRELSRWQIFFAVMISIGAAIFMVMTLLQALWTDDIQELITGLICPAAFVLLFYVLPAVQLWRAAGAASRYANSSSANELTEFASTQLAFWRTIGIMAAILLVIFVFFMIAAAITASVYVNR